MRKLVFACSLMLVSSIGFAQTGKMSVDECATEIYENTSASYGGAREFCMDRRDAKFIGCVIDLYNDLDQDHTLPSAEIECNRRLRHPLQNQCYAILQRAQFSAINTENTCQWALEATNSLSIVKCAARLRSQGNEQVNSVNVCWGQYKAGELTAEGLNKVEIERQRKAAEAERARKAELARQEQARRQAEAARLAELQRQVELKRQRDLEQRRDRLALEKAEREERERRVSLERQEERLRRERLERERLERQRAEDRARREEPRVVITVPKVTPKKNNTVSAAEKARKAEELRRAEEDRNWEEMQREERARQAREAAKKQQNKKVDVTPREEIPPKKNNTSGTVKKNTSANEEERRRREEEVQRKTEEGRRRVEQARQEAEQRRQEEAREREERAKKDQGQKTDPSAGQNNGTTSGNGDILPPPTSGGVITDMPDPSQN